MLVLGSMKSKLAIRALVLLAAAMICGDLRGDELPAAWKDGRFAWEASGPLLDAGVGREAADPHLSIKDPSIVFHEGRWHLFGTLRKKSGTVCMQYLNFTEKPTDAGTFYRPDAYRRLQAVKAAVDPDGVFRANHPIA